MFTTEDWLLAHRNDFAGPHQGELARRLVDGIDRDEPAAGTISDPEVTHAHILDAQAWRQDLLPDEAGWMLAPLDVVMFQHAPLSCWLCDCEAIFEIPGLADRAAAFLCQSCALTTVGDCPLGPGNAQLLMAEESIPFWVRDLCRNVAAEVHADVVDYTE